MSNCKIVVATEGERVIYVSQPREEFAAKAWKEDLAKNSNAGVDVRVVSLGEGELLRERLKSQKSQT